MTSRNEIYLDIRYPRRIPCNARMRAHHLPIEPCKPHPDNGILLKMAPQCQDLSKKSYIKTEKQFTVHLSILREYNRNKHSEYVLSDESYRELVRYCGFKRKRAIRPAVPGQYDNAIHGGSIRICNVGKWLWDWVVYPAIIILLLYTHDYWYGEDSLWTSDGGVG